jgi:hypothetical protein
MMLRMKFETLTSGSAMAQETAMLQSADSTGLPR